MTEPTPHPPPAEAGDESALPTPSQTEQTDPDLSTPPPIPEKTVLERPYPADRATVVETPDERAYKATEWLPDTWDVAAFLVIWPGQQRERRVAVEIPVTYIGRVPGNQVLLDDTALSRHHARIVREGVTYVLYDQNSTNGTFVYDDRSRQWERVTRWPLSNDTEIRIGRTLLRFKLTPPGR